MGQEAKIQGPPEEGLYLRAFLVILAALVVVSIGATLLLSRYVESAVRQNAIDETVGMVRPIVLRIFSPQDLAQPLTGETYQQRAQQIRETIMEPHSENLARLKLWNPSGVTVFSTLPEQVGETHPDNPELLEALGTGQVAWELESETESVLDRDLGEVLGVYVPLAWEPGQPPTGVLELYIPYAHWALLFGRIQRAILIALTLTSVVVPLGLVLVYRQGWIAIRRERDQAVESQERYRAVALSAVDAMVLADREGTITGWNRAAEATFGYTSQEALGQPLTIIVPERYREAHLQGLARMSMNGEPRIMGRTVELSALRKDGSEFPIELSLARGETARGIFYSASVRDIMARKQAEQALQESRQMLENIAEGIADPVMLLSRDFRILWANRAASQQSGYTPEEMAGSCCYAVSHLRDTPCEPPHDPCPVLALQTGQTSSAVVHTHYDREGNPRTVEVSAYPIRNEHGEAVQFVHVSRDITERVATLEALRRSEALYRGVVESSPDAIMLTDLQGTVRACNARAMSLRGVGSVEAMVGQNAFDMVAPEDRQRMQQDMQDAMTGASTGPHEYSLLRANGTAFPAELTTSIIRDAQGNPEAIIGVVRDITERTRAQEQLLQQHHRLSTLYAIADAGAQSLDLERVLQRCLNVTAKHLTFEAGAVSLLEPHSETLTLRAHSGLSQAFLAAAHPLHVGEGATGRALAERRIVILDRSTPLSERLLPQMAEEGLETLVSIPLLAEEERVGVMTLGARRRRLFSLEDMELLSAVGLIVGNVARQAQLHGEAQAELGQRRKTEEDLRIRTQELEKAIQQLRETQAHLIRADRLASLGQLVSGIAHEINNPLTSVFGFAQLLMAKDLSAEVKADLQIIQDESQRAASIVRTLLTFSRQYQADRRLVAVNEALSGVLALRAYQMKVHNINQVVELDPDLPQTVADFHQLQQVFLNIIINAEQAMTKAHGGGNLQIKTTRGSGSIRITFTDDGPGIPKENLARVFDPFFTTKEPGEGTGLGLSICYGIVQEHRGEITVESEEGKGATFTVEIPILTEAQRLAAMEAPPPAGTP